MVRGQAVTRWCIVSVAVTALAACRPASAPEPITVGPPLRPAAPRSARSPGAPRILSAHLAVVETEALGGDGIPVVFSDHVDAASLHPEAFLVAFGDGGRVSPSDATLAPASENDENRTVLLVGDFGDPQERPPTDVVVVGNLFTEGGEGLQGLTAEVSAFETGGHVVFAESMAPSTDGIAPVCPGAEQVIRTYWIDGLREVQAVDLEGIEVTLEGGGTVAPVGFDDHDLDDQEREDNVLDLCLQEAPKARRVKIAAGLFRDPAGHRSAAVDVEVR